MSKIKARDRKGEREWGWETNWEWEWARERERDSEQAEKQGETEKPNQNKIHFGVHKPTPFFRLATPLPRDSNESCGQVLLGLRSLVLSVYSPWLMNFSRWFVFDYNRWNELNLDEMNSYSRKTKMFNTDNETSLNWWIMGSSSITQLIRPWTVIAFSIFLGV